MTDPDDAGRESDRQLGDRRDSTLASALQIEDGDANVDLSSLEGWPPSDTPSTETERQNGQGRLYLSSASRTAGTVRDAVAAAVPGMAPNAPKRNVLVALLYLFALSILLHVLREVAGI